MITNLSGDDERKKAFTTQSRLVHLHSRVVRIPENNLSPLQQSAKSALLLDILSSLDSLDQICNNDPDVSRQMQELAQDDFNSHMSQLLIQVQILMHQLLQSRLLKNLQILKNGI